LLPRRGHPSRTKGRIYPLGIDPGNNVGDGGRLPSPGNDTGEDRVFPDPGLVGSVTGDGDGLGTSGTPGGCETGDGNDPGGGEEEGGPVHTNAIGGSQWEMMSAVEVVSLPVAFVVK